jgi:hypothetical protein
MMRTPRSKDLLPGVHKTFTKTEQNGRNETMDIASLANLLHETSERHGSFEAVAPPHDWWDWYAAYIAARQSGSSEEDASAAAGRYMAEVKHVVVPPTSDG